MRFKKRHLALLAAVLFGLASAAVTYNYLLELNNRTVPTLVKPQLEQVVVAVREIPSKTVLTRDAVAYAEFPAEAILPGSITEIEEVIGMVTKSPIVAGEIINASRLWPKGTTPGLTFQIPLGKRAITIGINEVIGVAGFVKPGDYVDVLATLEAPNGGYVTTTILQHVLVLAVAQQTEDREGGEAKLTTTLTLAVTLDEAEKLTLAEEQGVLRIVLRPAGQHEVLQVASTSTEKLLAGNQPQPLARPVAPAGNVVTIKRIDPPPPAPPKPVKVQVEVIKGTTKQIVEVVK